MFSLVPPKFQLPKIGLFTWNVPENRLVADEVYASIYGLNAGELARGVEIEEVIALIFEGDRERAARSTHAAILAGKSVRSITVSILATHSATFRLMDGAFATKMAFRPTLPAA